MRERCRTQAELSRLEGASDPQRTFVLLVVRERRGPRCPLQPRCSRRRDSGSSKVPNQGQLSIRGPCTFVCRTSPTPLATSSGVAGCTVVVAAAPAHASAHESYMVMQRLARSGGVRPIGRITNSRSTSPDCAASWRNPIQTAKSSWLKPLVGTIGAALILLPLGSGPHNHSVGVVPRHRPPMRFSLDGAPGHPREPNRVRPGAWR
jgi:hypothetical protein